MLEGMTALGFIAAHSERARIGLMVGGIHYRRRAYGSRPPPPSTCSPAAAPGSASARPGTSRSRRDWASPLPPLQRALRVAGGHAPDGPRHVDRRERQRRGFEGRHVTATHLLNSPQAISRPRIPIMVGGGGEQKTLRLVAQYADACNVFGGNRSGHAQVRSAARALRAAGPSVRGDRALEPAGGRPRQRIARRGRWTGSASSAKPAASTSSSACAAWPTPPGSSGWARRSFRSCASRDRPGRHGRSVRPAP